jgi:predicted ABC-type ATPase
MALDRVARRVRAGGHYIPDDVVIGGIGLA